MVGKILAIFNRQVITLLSTKPQVSWPSKFWRRNDEHLGFPIVMILFIYLFIYLFFLFLFFFFFGLQVNPNAPYQVSKIFKFRRREENRFSWCGFGDYRISTQNEFTFFFIYKSSWCFQPSFKSTGISVQERNETKIKIFVMAAILVSIFDL